MADKENINLTDKIMVVDTSKQTFDVLGIQNRYFMFNPQTSTLLLWQQYKQQEHYYADDIRLERAGIKEPLEQFVRGWVGAGRSYRNGVIHFAPALSHLCPKEFEKAFDTVVMFSQNNVNEKTVIRSFGKLWEQPLSTVLEAGRVPPALEEKPSVHKQLKAGQPKQKPKAKKAARQDAER